MSEQPTPVGPSSHDEHSAIHLTPPSYWPIVMAVGIAAALSGVVINTFVWIAGVLIILVALAGWMQEVGRDIQMAPDEPET
ncbi:MAG TPA: cytochrome c oxidase subunit 4 [Chloroflexota bacterium]|nr:cytochrome c oxidase subunit 4 [Chloroflexota bacterium]